MKRKLARVVQQGIHRVGVPRRALALALAVWGLGATACGPVGPEESAGPPEWATQAQQVRSLNGLSVNGLSVNGLSVNGLSVNGLAAVEFLLWFNEDPDAHDAVMEYVSKCALAAGESLTYVNPLSGQAYTWPGLLGLAPDWSAGAAPTRREQHVVSACLAAHINKFGVHVPLSVLGRNAQGVPVPVTPEELRRFSEREACFFGNYFNGRGGFATNDRPLLKGSESSSRACGMSSRSKIADCPAVKHVGSCDDFCTLDATGTFYTHCTYQGETFFPLTTRIKPQEIFTCGDGVCQFTEHCGNGGTPDSCKADCGKCR